MADSNSSCNIRVESSRHLSSVDASSSSSSLSLSYTSRQELSLDVFDRLVDASKEDSMHIASTSRSAHSGVNVDTMSSSSSSKSKSMSMSSFSPCHECLLCFETVSAHFAESRNTLRSVHCLMFVLLILEVCSPTAPMKSTMVGSIDDDVILVVFDGGGGVYYVLNIMGCLCCFERLYVLLVY